VEKVLLELTRRQAPALASSSPSYVFSLTSEEIDELVGLSAPCVFAFVLCFLIVFVYFSAADDSRLAAGGVPAELPEDELPKDFDRNTNRSAYYCSISHHIIILFFFFLLRQHHWR
jgi:hypothetical protein